jgi:trimeric autotransporter adhesin
LFNTVSGAQRGDLAAFDAASGALLGWNPNGDGDVQALANDGQTVVAGGQLNSVGGVNHQYLAAIDTTTGKATGLDLGLDGSVTAITSGGQTLFIAGGFAHVQGQFRDWLAEFNPSTGQVTSWQPQAQFADNTPEALAVSTGTVYVGGEFSGFNTSKGFVSRRALAAFSRTTGKLTSWNPSADGAVFTLALTGGLIYAGGVFEHIGFTPRNGVAAITAQGSATSWNANVNLTGVVDALQIAGSTVYLGGSFDSLAGQSRVDLAAVTASSGALLPWAPNTTAPFGTVQTLIAGGNTVYVGGNFLQLQGHVGLAPSPPTPEPSPHSGPTSIQAAKSPPWRSRPPAPSTPAAASPTSPAATTTTSPPSPHSQHAARPAIGHCPSREPGRITSWQHRLGPAARRAPGR